MPVNCQLFHVVTKYNKVNICSKLPLVCISVSCVLLRGEESASSGNYSVSVTGERKINGEKIKQQGKKRKQSFL